jgi:hypothetical protein
MIKEKADSKFSVMQGVEVSYQFLYGKGCVYKYQNYSIGEEDSCVVQGPRNTRGRRGRESAIPSFPLVLVSAYLTLLLIHFCCVRTVKPRSGAY